MTRASKSRQVIPILTYHQISLAPKKGTPYRSLCVTPNAFFRQMKLLKLLGYTGVSMGRLYPYLTGEKSGKVIGITFDDGYKNNLEFALPVLEALGFSSTCYVVSKQIGGSNQWDLEAGVPQVPLMTREDLRSWIAGGQEIGAHTRSHPHLCQLSLEHAAEEILNCKSDLYNAIGRSVNHFCYPYGEYNKEVIGLVEQAGYNTATTTKRGRTCSGDNPLMLSRVPILRTTTLLTFVWKIMSTYEDRK
jgi:peptidoglycan/xylan/chitin deacetylase (PgdA/CDA1 family)